MSLYENYCDRVKCRAEAEECAKRNDAIRRLGSLPPYTLEFSRSVQKAISFGLMYGGDEKNLVKRIEAQVAKSIQESIDAEILGE